MGGHKRSKRGLSENPYILYIFWNRVKDAKTLFTAALISPGFWAQRDVLNIYYQLESIYLTFYESLNQSVETFLM